MESTQMVLKLANSKSEIMSFGIGTTVSTKHLDK